MDIEPVEKPVAFKSIRVWARAVAEDPPRMRFYSHVVVVVFGWFLVTSPLSTRLVEARADLVKAHKNEARAKAHLHLVDQQERYEPMLTGSENILDWQNYLLSKVDSSDAELSTLEPFKAEKRGPFMVMRFHVTVKASQFEALADLLDRVEHGERLVRVEDMQISQSKDFMLMTFVVRGLVKRGMPEIPLEDEVGGTLDGEQTPEASNGTDEPRSDTQKSVQDFSDALPNADISDS
ncbi:MAG: hypothetical protein ACI9EF_000202 [Pseudohongiellaceae bacterium]|jgi:hypothetical protein